VKTDMHSFAENFIPEDEVITRARARGIEVGAQDISSGTGSLLRFLAHLISAQSVVEVGTGSGAGSIWLLRGMIESGTLTSIDAEAEHARIARQAFADDGISPQRFRLITNPVMDVISKLTDRAYDLVVLRNDPADLAVAVEEAHRILRSGGVLVIDTFFGGAKVNDPAQRDPQTIARREAGKAIKSAPALWVSSLFLAGDGVLVAIKR